VKQYKSLMVSAFLLGDNLPSKKNKSTTSQTND